jgi:uncharacterized protein YnzC (UPF0291/DUF896 family)
MLKAHSPEILLFLGIIGTVASAILACRATLRVEEVLDDHKEKIEKINECWEKVKEGEIALDEYSEQDHKKDLVVTYTQTAVDFIKLYGLPVILGVASIACIIGGHGIMAKRNVALVAAYKAVEEGFKAYRKRVIEEHGEQADYMYKHGLRSETVVENEVGEDGKTHKVKKIKLVEDPNGLSMYARFFDESCSQWSKTSEYNLMFLRAQQNYHNDMLKARGHVFLNEVYDALGIQRTQAGAIVGWVIGDGDNFIDFGIFDGDRTRARDFVNGYERTILLDFNVDGVIYDLFTKEKV